MRPAELMKEKSMPKERKSSKMVLLFCINFANLTCHAVYSVLAAFFPQQAKVKGMGEDMVGILFAIFAFIIFIFSPQAGVLMDKHGKRKIYILAQHGVQPTAPSLLVSGLFIVSAGTILFSFASILPGGFVFASWCFCMRILQGLGSAMEETAAYALIANVDPNNVSLYLGITEISTGLGYMVGPPLGGLLFAIGGFACPFIVLGVLIIPTIFLVFTHLAPETSKKEDDAAVEGDEDKESEEFEAPPAKISTVLRRPQVALVAAAAVLANSDYAFMEPTLGEHVSEVISSEASIGLLFSVASITYTISCPLIGYLSNRDRFGPRKVILIGLVLQLVGFLVIGPCPLTGLKMEIGLVVFALVMLGIGEAMSMTPIMDDMLGSCSDLGPNTVNTLSSIMAASFSLGQMVGPLLGSALTSRLGFQWSSTVVACMLALQISCMMFVGRKQAPKGYGEVEMSSPPHAV